MNRVPNKYFIFFIPIIFWGACNSKKTNATKKNDIGKLISIEFKDKKYAPHNFAKDTITPDGWKIEYLVKNDTTKYSDIYIECSKGNLKSIFYGKQLLELKEYFIPEYIAETKSYIFFKHGCASDCAALLVFDKNRSLKYKDYEDVIDYNTTFGQILYVTNKAYEEGQIYDLSLVDLIKEKEHHIAFKNLCDASYKPSCIDTIIFTQSIVTIKTTLRESINSNKEIKSTKTIKL